MVGPWLTWFSEKLNKLITKPGVQKPHCDALHCTNASCAGCSGSSVLPSFTAGVAGAGLAEPQALQAARLRDAAALCTVQACAGRLGAAALSPPRGQRVREVASVEVPSSPVGAAEPALPGRRRSAPSGGSAVREATSVGAISSTVHSAMPSIEWARRMQLLTARKRSAPCSICPSTTVQAPQSPSPHPSLVPVQPSSSRSSSNTVHSGGTLPTLTTSPRRTKRRVLTADGTVKGLRVMGISLDHSDRKIRNGLPVTRLHRQVLRHATPFFKTWSPWHQACVKVSRSAICGD